MKHEKNEPGARGMRKDVDTLQAELDRRTVLHDELSTKLVAANQRGSESADLFRLLVTSVRDYAIFMLDPDGNVATWNAGAEHFKGYTAGEIIGRHFSTFYPDEDVRAGKCELELAEASRGGRFEDEGWRIRKDGTRFWANVVITAVRDDRDTLIGFAKVTRDLTTRKLEEDRRRAAEEKLRLLVESVQDYALFMLDPDGKVASWNAGAQRIKGYSAGEIIGRHFSVFYPAEDIATGKCERELETAIEEGRFEEEGWRLRKDGTSFWANVVIAPLRDHDGELLGFSKVTRDLTERKRIEAEHAARLAAEQANRAKDEFLAMLGHELRNPLAPISTALQLIELRGDTSSAKEHQIIARQVNHMVRLVDDLLDIAKITGGKITLKRGRVDLRDALAKALEVARPVVEERQQYLQVSSPSEPIIVDGDEARLIQVFSNLVNNAAKYTQPGGHISVALREESGCARIEISDDGAGIGGDLLLRVFDLFVQGEQGADRGGGGLGLGLALVRSLVHLHGGDVSAHSEGAGRGSMFVVRLPLATASKSQIPAAAPRPALTRTTRPRRVLIVDDHEDARSLLAELLVELGHDVRNAGDGPGALQVIRMFAPEVAIVDIGLPVMDGYELAKRLRETEPPERLRLIALTGYSQPTHRERTRAAGFDQHLVKPVDLDALLRSLDEP